MKFTFHNCAVCVRKTVFEPVTEITPEMQRKANKQWEEERMDAGDPPYSIGNDWLQDLKKANGNDSP